MSDGVKVNVGTGPAIDTHELDSGGGVLVQRQKVQLAGSAFGDLVGVTSGALNVHIADALGVTVANFPANQTVTVSNVSIPVTGTFWQATQPVSGTVNVGNFPVTQPVSLATNTPDVTDRSGRLLGHVTVDNSSIAVTGTFWQATQPISGTVTVSNPTANPETGLAKDATFAKDADGGIKTHIQNFPSSQAVTGTVSVSNFPATQAVTGTFWQTTQPVSISATVNTAVQNFPATQAVSGTVAVSNFPATQPVSGTVTVSNPYAGDVSDRAARLLGHVTVDNSSLAITASSLPLPTGAATQATLTDGTQKTQVTNFPASQTVSGTVAVSKTPNSGSPVVISTNSLTTVYTPASGKSIKLNWLGLASPETNSAPVIATVKLGATTIYQWPLGAPGAFAHSGNRVGAPDAALTVQLSASGQTVYVNPDIEEI